MRPIYSNFNPQDLDATMDMEKRRFKRIPFDAKVNLEVTNRTLEPITGLLEDISLKGALITVDQSLKTLNVGDEGKLTISPEQGDIEISLTVDVAYSVPTRHAYGLNLISLDVESAGHLRRLVEVNLGNEESLQRELTNLIEAMEKEHRSS
jgi:hypothetical protein